MAQTGMDFGQHQQATQGFSDSADAYSARLNQMVQSADAILAGFKGHASKAFTDAHTRLHEAASKQQQLLHGSVGTHQQAASKFQGAEEENAQPFSHINL